MLLYIAVMCTLPQSSCTSLFVMKFEMLKIMNQIGASVHPLQWDIVSLVWKWRWQKNNVLKLEILGSSHRDSILYLYGSFEDLSVGEYFLFIKGEGKLDS